MRSALFSVVMATGVTVGWAQAPQTIVLRGHQQTLHVYGSPRGEPIIVSSGDGGWIHLSELGWRWKDSLIYLTHKVPNEPTFSAAAIVANVAPIPLAAIHSTHDEFVSLTQIQNVLNRAAVPKRLWIVKASDHRFSDNLPEFDQRLLEAIEWVRANAPR